MGKSDLVGFVGNDMVRGEHERVLYENDEVGVMHSIAHFANGSASEAVLSFARFKDGKIVRMETGATPLSEDYTLVGQDDSSDRIVAHALRPTCDEGPKWTDGDRKPCPSVTLETNPSSISPVTPVTAFI